MTGSFMAWAWRRTRPGISRRVLYKATHHGVGLVVAHGLKDMLVVEDVVAFIKASISVVFPSAFSLASFLTMSQAVSRTPGARMACLSSCFFSAPQPQPCCMGFAGKEPNRRIAL